MKTMIRYPTFISAPATAVLGQKCYTSLLEHLDLSDTDCIKFAISKALGVGVVAGGCIVKVPQIAIIWRTGSGRGVSLPAYILELVSCAINSVYSIRNGYPFSTYGENLFLTIQNAIITVLIVNFKPRPSPHRDSNAAQVLTTTITIAVSAAILTLLPMPELTLLQGLTIPISAIAKIPQIITNEKNKSTGNLAAFTVIANVLGCYARVFTTLTEVKDPLVLWGFILASVLNTVIGIQLWAYWGKGDAKLRLPTEKDRLKKGEKYESVTTAELQPPTRNVLETPERKTPPAYTPSPSTTTPAGGKKWARKVD